MKTYSYKGQIITAESREEAIKKIVAKNEKPENQIDFSKWVTTNYKQVKELTGFIKTKNKHSEPIFSKKLGKFTIEIRFGYKSITIELKEGTFRISEIYEYEKSKKYSDEDYIKRINDTIKKAFSKFNVYLKYKSTGFKSLFEKTLKDVVSNPIFKGYTLKKYDYEYSLPGYEYQLTRKDSGLTYIIKVGARVNEETFNKNPIKIFAEFFINSAMYQIEWDIESYPNTDKNISKKIINKMNELDSKISNKEKYQKEAVSIKQEIEILNKNKNKIIKRANDGIKLLVSSKLPNFFSSCEIKGNLLKLYVADKYRKIPEIDRAFTLSMIINTSQNWKKLVNVLDNGDFVKNVRFKYNDIHKDFSVSYWIYLKK